MFEKYFKDNNLIVFDIKEKQDKLVLQKENAYKSLSIKKNRIKYIDAKSLDILKEQLRNYLIVMTNNCKNFDSKIFLENFNKLTCNIEKMHSNNKTEEAGYFYYFLKKHGKCELGVNNLGCINTELNHMASIPVNNRKKLNKFISDQCVFSPFYEAYTQILSERYFKEVNSGYIISKQFTKVIETIIGKDYIETEYFKGEIQKAFNKLNVFLGISECVILTFMGNEIYDFETDVNFGQVDYVQCLIDEMYKILFKCFKTKLKDIKSIEEREKLLNKKDWVWNVNFKNNDSIVSFHGLSEEEYDEFYNELSSNNLKKLLKENPIRNNI